MHYYPDINRMVYQIFGIACCLVILSLTNATASSKTVIIGIPNAELPQYEVFIAEKGQAPKDISSFNSPRANRTIASVVLMQKAAYLGGFKKDVLVVGGPILPEISAQLP